MKTLVLAAALLFPATQDKDDLFKKQGIKLGDRVELTLKSGFAIRGKLVQTAIDENGRVVVTANPAIDISTVSIMIDMTMEYPDTPGQMGLDRVQIVSVRKLPEMTLQEAQELEKARQKAIALRQKEEDARRARAAKEEQQRQKEADAAEKRRKESESSSKVGGDLEQKLKDLKEGEELFKRFPPEAGWGPERLDAIAKKGMAQIRPTQDEVDFQKNYAAWSKHKAFLDSEKKDKAAPENP